MQELEKILEEINETIERYGKNPHIDENVMDMCYGLNIAKNIICKHMNDGWISVDERLPEEAGTYIINALTGERSIVTFAKWQNRYKRFDMTGARAYWRVIAWKPLPEPYRPEQPETCKYTGGSCCWPIDQCGECPNNQERSDNHDGE